MMFDESTSEVLSTGEVIAVFMLTDLLIEPEPEPDPVAPPDEAADSLDICLVPIAGNVSCSGSGE